MLMERAASLPPAPPVAVKSRPQEVAPAIDEAQLFREAFAGVRRLANGSAERLIAAPAHKTEIISEDAEVLAALSDLVSGQGKFELTESDEYVEGMRTGLDPRLVTRLRRGEFSVQAHIDLHGLYQVDAKEKLTQFILESVQKGLRAVLVVHGRGLRSPGGQPVLKHAAAQWLSHGVIGGYVLAFTSAQAYDGGAGAMWVLLRRERRRAKFDVMKGAKMRD
jgi:DNA-nicking Smr family endonuclease